jgi:DNA-binding response OmpR family regulator
MADDEPEQIRPFARILEQEGYEVGIVEDDLEALYLLDEWQPDMIILDIRFGYNRRKGLDILKEIREKNNTLPIIMLTGLSDVRLPEDSIDRDADYFVSKSEPTGYLLALVQRCLRRSKPGVIRIDDRIEIDPGNYSVKVKRDCQWQPLHFERKEFDLLYKLVSNPGRVIRREDLYYEFFPDAKDPAVTLNRYISELRKKLEPEPDQPQYILTKRGIGYWFKDYR